MFSAFDWGNSPLQPFLTSNWHFWQMTQMSDKCLICKIEEEKNSDIWTNSDYPSPFKPLLVVVPLLVGVLRGNQLKQDIQREPSNTAVLAADVQLNHTYWWSAQSSCPPPIYPQVSPWHCWIQALYETRRTVNCRLIKRVQSHAGLCCVTPILSTILYTSSTGTPLDSGHSQTWYAMVRLIKPWSPKSSK